MERGDEAIGKLIIRPHPPNIIQRLAKTRPRYAVSYSHRLRHGAQPAVSPADGFFIWQHSRAYP